MKHIRLNKTVHDALKRHRRRALKPDVVLPPQKPLRLRSFLQRVAYCGPASIKIVCDYFGRDLGELAIGRACGTTTEHGTTQHGMIEGAEKLGAMVFASHGGTIEDLRFFLHHRHLPVIVAWYSATRPRFKRFDPSRDIPWGHFSVLYHISKTHVYMMDPETAKRSRMAISRFKHLWWDTDAERRVSVRHWYMVMNFEVGV